MLILMNYLVLMPHYYKNFDNHQHLHHHLCLYLLLHHHQSQDSQHHNYDLVLLVSILFQNRFHILIRLYCNESCQQQGNQDVVQSCRKVALQHLFLEL